MITDATYAAVPAARQLLLLGAWDLALGLLAGADGEGVPELRAQILVERNWWRLDDPAAALAAADALPHAPLLRGQLAYTRLLFDPTPSDDDAALAGSAFQSAADDPATAGWGSFWQGVLRQNIHEDDAAARPSFDEALRRSREEGDLLLESYVVRHLSDYEADPTPLLRRSLQLRAALGARPQVAAAQMSLAGELPEGAERALLLEASRATAEELGLTWVLRFLV
ncbi:hypothetical protein [Streptacidiphilus jiangxiensis]|nr:hypothetical protein [Streptacidiphilus jiangxiensis]